jgi:OFA family oxalate/formate antiporter-like MFS transporter
MPDQAAGIGRIIKSCDVNMWPFVCRKAISPILMAVRVLKKMLINSPTHITISIYRGWLVTLASAVMGSVLGILYVWSVVKDGIPDSWGWSNADKALPYSVMCIMFSTVMVPAGRFQDRYGPRWVVLLGGFLAGLGCIMSGLGGSSNAAYIIGFGMFTGAGVGFGYSALTPAAIK